MSKKRFLPLALGLVAALSLNASPAHAGYTTPCDYEGFYVGLSGGVSYLLGTFERFSGFQQLAIHRPIVFSHNSKTHTKGGIAGLTIGMSRLVDSLYLAVEASGYLSEGKLPLPVEQISPHAPGFAGFNGEVRINNGLFAVDFVPGFVLCDTFLLFGKIGVTGTRYRLQSDSFFNVEGLRTREFERLSVPLSKLKNKYALHLGLGLAHYIADDFVLTVNYGYANFGNVIASGFVGPFAEGIGTQTSTFKARLRQETIMLGLNYYFHGF